MVTACSSSSCRRKASNSSSARSISSTSRTHGAVEGLQERPGQQEPFGVERSLGGLDVEVPVAGGLEGAQVQELTGEVPFVERLGGVDVLVALEADERALQRGGQGDGERGLAGAGFSFAEERAAHPQGEEPGGGEPVVGEVPGRVQRGGEFFRRVGHAVDRRRHAGHRPGRSARRSTSRPLPRSPHSMSVRSERVDSQSRAPRSPWAEPAISDHQRRPRRTGWPGTPS